MKRSFKVVAAVALLGLLLNVGLATVLNVSVAQPAYANVPTSPQVAQQPQRPRQLVVHVYFRSIAERNELAMELGADEQKPTPTYIEAWIDQARYEELLARGLKVEIDQVKTLRANDPLIFLNLPFGFYNGYRTVAENTAFLNSKAAQYPTLAEVQDIGNSWCKDHAPCTPYPGITFNGHDLLVMHITNRNIAGPKPVFWYDAGIHSREIATPEVAQNYISYLLDNYNTNADARWLVDYHDIYVMPMLNPDGHYIVEQGGGGNSPYYQRKNADIGTPPACTSVPPSNGGSNQIGVDLNRNYPFAWGAHNGSSGNRCSQTYRGTAPSSEPEIISVTAKIRTLIPDQNGPGTTEPTVYTSPLTSTGIIQNMHSYAELNLWPWGGIQTAAPNKIDLQNIGNHMSATEVEGNGYISEQAIGLYATDGTSDDWGYGELGAAAYTTEVSDDGLGFLPQYSYTQNQIWPENRGMLLYMAKLARTPYLTTRGPDVRNLPSGVITVTQGTDAMLMATISHNWTANNYRQNIAAAEYYVDTPPWVGGTASPMSATDGSFDSVTEPVQASVPTGSLSVGRHIVFMRGRGVNDYEGYQSWGPITAVFVDVNNPSGATPTAVATNTAQATATSILPTVTLTPLLTLTPQPTATTQATATTQVTATPVLPTLTVLASSTAQPTATVQPSGTAQATSTAGASPTACPVINFTDVPTRNIFYGDIQFLACRRIINGFPNGDGTFRFEPNSNTRRGEFAKIAVLAFNIPLVTPGGQSFNDVPSGNIFYIYIESAKAAGVIQGLNAQQCAALGTPGTCYGPNLNVSRGQAAAIVQRARNFTVVTPTSGQTFADVPPSYFAFSAIETLASRSIISGAACGSSTCFRPNDNITRGELAKVTRRAMESN